MDFPELRSAFTEGNKVNEEARGWDFTPCQTVIYSSIHFGSFSVDDDAVVTVDTVGATSRGLHQPIEHGCVRLAGARDTAADSALVLHASWWNTDSVDRGKLSHLAAERRE